MSILTPLFIILAGRYAQATGDLETLRNLWPSVLRALAWIDGPGDRDHDGFVEYFKTTPHGLENQGWKDSADAVFHADGRLAEGPIALAEVQGYVYAAKKLASWCADQKSSAEAERAIELDGEAATDSRNASRRRFWCEENSGTYALALDGNKRPCRASPRPMPGRYCLAASRAATARSRSAKQLLQPDLFSGWGVRTVAGTASRYNPMSYHNGSVWPHDNAMVAWGLSRYGETAAAARIFAALFDAATYMDLRRLPELFCGFARA